MADKTLQIQQIKNQKEEPIAPITVEKAVFDENGQRLSDKLKGIDLNNIKNTQDAAVNLVNQTKEEAVQEIQAQFPELKTNIGLTEYEDFVGGKNYKEGDIFKAEDKLYICLEPVVGESWQSSWVSEGLVKEYSLKQDLENQITETREEAKTELDKEITERKSLIDIIEEVPGFCFGLVDAKGSLILGVKEDGSCYQPKGMPEETKKAFEVVKQAIDLINKKVNISEARIEEFDHNKFIYAIVDKSDNVLWAIDKNGKCIQQKGIPEESQKNFGIIYKNLAKLNSQLVELEHGTYLYSIVDSNGVLLWGIDKEGNCYQPKGMPEETKKALAIINEKVHLKDVKIVEYVDDNYVYAIIDKNDNVLWAIKKDGTCYQQKGIPDEVALQLNTLNSYIKEIDHGIYVLSFVDSEQNFLFGVDKQGKFKIGSAFAQLANTNFEEIETNKNQDTLYHIVDNDGKVLFNITKDGKLVGQKGIILDGFKSGFLYEDNEDWLFAITDVDGNLLAGIDKNTGFYCNKLIGAFKAEQIEDKNYIFALCDKNDNLLLGIKKDGTICPSKVKLNELETVEENEFIYFITDNQGYIVFGIYANGKIYAPKGIPTEVKKILDSYNSRLNSLEEALNSQEVKTKIDWSDKSYIQIEEPRCAIINITGTNYMPTSKTQNLHAWVEFWDMRGNYFKKRAILNAQGNSSMGFVKKNAAFDFCDDNWIGDETPSIRFGKWVPQDSFHMKAYYTDFFRGVGAVSYKFYETIVASRGNKKDRPWKKELINMDSIKTTTNSFANPLQDNLTLEFDTGARCFPDGFPVICYLNNEFYGVFAWQLKKHRDNFHLDKKNPANIHLDGDLYGQNIWNNNVNWSAFEIRNPKNLYCINTIDVSGFGYNSLIDEAEIATIGNNYQEVEEKPSDFTNDYIVSTYGNTPPTYLYRKSKDKWYKLVNLNGKKYLPYDGDHPVELIDSSMPYFDPSNKDHVNTDKVKQFIKNLSNAVSKIKEAEDIYKASTKTEEDLNTFKKVIETYCDKENQIDYIIYSDLIKNSDGFGKNWQWFTYNGIKWYVGVYDCDMSFGGHFQGNQITPPLTNHISTSKSNFHGYIIAYYADELKARYKELSDKGIISKENLFGIFKDWTMRIGVENYELEYKKWKDSPCYGESKVRSDYWVLLYEEDGVTPKMDTSETFNATQIYNINDEVSFGLNSIMGYYKFKCIKATEALETNSPHTISKFSPISSFRHTDNIYRVEKWIETEIANMDKVYGYVRN